MGTELHSSFISPRPRQYDAILDWAPVVFLMSGVTVEMVTDPLENLHILEPIKALFLHSIAICGVSSSVFLLIYRTFFLKKLIIPLILGLLLIVGSLLVQLLLVCPWLYEDLPFGRNSVLEIIAKKSFLWAGLGLLMTGLFLAALEVRRIHLSLLLETEALNKEILGRKQVDQELISSEQRYRAVIDTSADGFAVINRDGRFTEVNDAYALLSGYSREELLTMHVADLDIGEQPEEMLAHSHEIMAKGTDLFESVQRAKDGTIRQVEVSISFWPIGGGQFFTFVRDIRSRKRSESLLRTRVELSSLAAHASINELLQAALAAAESYTDSRIGFFHLIDKDQENVRLQTWSPNTLDGPCSAEAKGQHYPISQAGVWVDCFYARQPVIHNDYANLTHRKGLPPGHVPVIREMAIPILREDLVVAIFGVGNKPTEYTQDDVDAVQNIASLVMDLVTRKQMQEALRQSEERYRTLVETTFDMVWETDTGERITYVSPRVESLLGFHPNEVIGKTPYELMPEEEVERVRALFGEVIAVSQSIFSMENTLRHRDGHLVVMEVCGVPYYSIDGRLMGYRGTNRDITERKRAETALRQSEERYRSLVETSSDWIWEIDATGRYTYVSPKGEEFLGYPTNEILGATPFDFMPEDEARRVEAIFFELISKRQPVIAIENVNRRSDGRLIVLETTGVPFFGVDGTFLGYHGTDRDITERRRAEKERLEMERRLLHTQKLESLGVLAGGIAHDFNNLLMAILGNLDLVLLDLTPSSPVRAGVKQAIQATRRATDLTRQMLAYSGRGHFVITHLDLNKLVMENVELFRTAITRTVTMKVDLAPHETPVKADAGQMQQVVMNLLTNAVEAMEGRAGVITLSTGMMECNEEYLAKSRIEEKPEPGLFIFVEVADTGCGMDEETQLRLFDPFFTTKFTGRGLGMSALLGIVRGHKGAILVDSAVEQGTTIRVLFPACDETIPSSESEVTSSPLSSGMIVPLSRILVVDDDETVRVLCQKLVKRLGHQAVSAADGEEAVKLFEKEGDTIACVLLDLTMPRMDGLETFRAMKKMRPDVRVILSSGYSECESIQRFSGEGLSGFIQKPYNLRELGKRIAEVLGSTANPF